MSKIILVLGMHRSGTSALAGMLHTGGIFMGEKLLRGDWSNPKGHFEDLAVQHINKDIFRSWGMKWDRILTNFNYNSVGPILIDRIKDLYLSYKNKYKIWGWKDPRMVFTFGTWYDVINNEDLRIIHVLRKPNSIASSLKKRNGIPVKVGIELTKIYNSQIMRMVLQHSLKVLQIEYETLISFPKDSQENIEHFCDIDLGSAYKFIESKLQHYK